MKRIHILSLIIFAVSVAVFANYKIQGHLNSDDAGPEIRMDQYTISVSAAAGEAELLAGVTAVDQRDGDVTGTLVVEKMGNFIEDGRREIVIAAFDSDNHITKSTREIVYTDYRAPRFSLTAPLKFPLGTSNVLANLSADDVLDGSLTGNIKMSGEYTITVDKAGDYPVLFTVSNSAGDLSSLPVTVTMYDRGEEGAKPQISLSQYIVYTTPGIPVNPWDYVLSIEMEGELYERDLDGVLRDMTPKEQQLRTEVRPEEVTAIQDFDYNVPGVYEMTYQITDKDGDAGSVRLIVVVSE